jgi:hypothetical protein
MQYADPLMTLGNMHSHGLRSLFFDLRLHTPKTAPPSTPTTPATASSLPRPSHNGCCHHNPRANDPINAGDRASLFEVNPTRTVRILTNSEMQISEITYRVAHIYQTEQPAMSAWRDSVKIPVCPPLDGTNWPKWPNMAGAPRCPDGTIYENAARDCTG